jgi:hypothetical protein
MMTSNMLHDRYHKQTGIAFSSIYPGCIAESPLFREKRPWFRKYFPIFMKYITGGFVGEEEAGMRLFQVAHDPRCSKSGVYWSWNGGPREGRGEEALEKDGQILGGGGAGGGWDSIYENDQSDKVLNKDTAGDLWKHSSLVTGAAWPPANQPKSPCPTLKVVGAATNFLNAKEEAKRMKPMPGNVVGLTGQVAGAAGHVVDKTLGNTIGTAMRKAQDAMLGGIPEEAVTGSFQVEDGKEKAMEIAMANSVIADTVPKKKRGLLRRLAFWRREAAQAAAVEEVEPVAAAADAEDALEDRVREVLAGGLPLPTARAALENCLGEEECDLEAEATRLRAEQLIID